MSMDGVAGDGAFRREPNGARMPGWLGWAFLIVLLLLEYGLFRQYLEREVLWTYPTQFDQTAYLLQSYGTYEKILDKGLAPGLAETACQHVPTGLLMHLQAGVVFLVLGPNRLSALTLNFFYFALLQCVLAWTLHRLTRRWSLALLGVGLLLTAQSPFLIPGGMMDFRIDFISFCLFGIFLCLVVRSGFLDSPVWSFAAGAVAGVLVLFRFLTAVYLTGIFVVVCFFLAAQFLMYWRRPAWPRQLPGLVASVVPFVLLVGPVFVWNRRALYDYYVVGHIIGPEKVIRSEFLGIFNWTEHLLFYPRSLLLAHTGWPFLVLAFVVLGCVLVARVLSRRTGVTSVAGGAFAWVFLAACIAVPLTILTLDVAKSPVVSCILVVPMLWLFLLPVVRRCPGGTAGVGGQPAGWVTKALAVVAIGVGVFTQMNQMSQRNHLSKDRAQVARLLGMYDALADNTEEFHLAHPRVSVDMVADFLFPGVLELMTYERHHRFPHIQPRLGDGIMDVSETAAFGLLENSDFVVIDSSDCPNYSSLPFDKCMETLRPKLLAWCEENCLLLQQTPFAGHVFNLYMRPMVRLEGESYGYITSKGLTLSGSSRALRTWSKIELRGKAHFEWLGKVPGVSCHLLIPGHPPVPVAATLEDQGANYVLTVHLDPNPLLADERVQLHLTFDAYFVPADLGWNADTRQLVLLTPHTVTLSKPR
jgi:hypothetical protein